MEKTRIYLAGKISEDKEFRKKFKEKEWELRVQGNIVLNPARLPNGLYYEDYMAISFALIKAADAVYFLNDYKESPGALRELEYAKNKNKLIFFEQ